MGCERFVLPGGVEGWVCSRGRQQHRCRFCGSVSAAQCDYPLRGARAGSTCSAHMCRSCATNQGAAADGDTIDYCPAHAKLAAKAANKNPP